MNRRDLLGLSLAISLGKFEDALCALPSVPPDQLISDETLLRILIDRIDRSHQSRGMVVGVTSRGGTRFVSYGSLDDARSGAVSQRTSFELGSVTKVFTSLLLVDAVSRKEVALSDPAAKYLPPGLNALARGGKFITLEQLATHTSGLPAQLNKLARDPSLQHSEEMTIEEANSDKQEDIYRFLSAYELPRDPGAQFEYSNLGMTLLGHILAKRADMDYPTLLNARVLRKLDLSETGGPDFHPKKTPFAVGHDAQLKAVPASRGLAGAGGLRSTAEDLIDFLNAAMGMKSSALKPAFDALLSVRRPLAADLEQSLGWQVRKFAGQEVVNKGGNTLGFCAFLGFDPARRIGVVVLSNSNSEIADIGFHILRPDYPLANIRATIPNDPSKLDGYVGVYRIDPPPTTMRVSRQGDELFVDINGSPKLRLNREKDQTFFLKEIELTFEFRTDQSGQASGLTLRQRNIPDVFIPRAESFDR